MITIRKFGSFAATWIAMSAIYLTQVSSWSAGEFIASSVIGGFAAVVLTSIRRCSETEFEVRWSWLWLLTKRLPGRALADCVVVFGALRRKRVAGEFRAVPFTKSSTKTKQNEDAARIALVIAGVSLAPNSVVVAVDPKRKRLLLHQLVHTRRPPGKGDRLWPL